MNDDYDDEEDDLFDDWDEEGYDDIEPKEDHEREDEHYNLEVAEGYGDKEAAYAKVKQPIFNIKELDL